MSVMAQEIVVRSLPEYPFGMSDIQTVSGIAKQTINATTGGSSANVITMGNSIKSSFTQTLTRTLTYNENAVYYLVLDHIATGSEKLRLAEPIAASVAYQDNVYFCQNEDLRIFSTSARLEDCIRKFEEEVVFVFNEYGKEDDDRLTKDARELKRRILQYISK